MSVAVVDMIPFRSRMTSRDPSLPKPRACRNLFGTPDPDEVNQMLASELRRYEEEDRRKYNFDFMSDSPIDGKNEWETVDPQDIPAFYRPVTVPSGRKSLPDRTPSMPSISIASEAGPVSVQSTSTSVDATVPNLVVLANLEARLHGDSSSCSPSNSTSSSDSPRTVTHHKDSKTTTSCAINSAKPGKKTTQSCRRRRQTSTSANQPKITEFLRVKKRSSPIEASADSKRRKEDHQPSTTTQSSAESAVATSSS